MDSQRPLVASTNLSVVLKVAGTCAVRTRWSNKTFELDQAGTELLLSFAQPTSPIESYQRLARNWDFSQKEFDALVENLLQRGLLRRADTSRRHETVMDKRLVIAVSIAKSGTHLTRKLLELLGYRVDGPILHAQSLEEYLLEAQELAHKTCLLIHSLPADIGWFGPELVERWHRTGSPPIIFNYRDPRDVLCSRIRFLIGETRHGKFEEHTENLLFSRILKSIQSKEERIRFMILQTEHYGISSFRRCSWMLRHPQVCCVRYEDLVGLRGGGDSTRQLQAIECIVAHLGVQVDVERVARQIYDENSPTFSQGKAGAWRREFSRENARLFRRAYWEILDAYGYNLD